MEEQTIYSPRAVGRKESRCTALTLTTLNEYELGNALRFAEFRKGIGPREAALFWAQYEADRASERLKIHVCNLAGVVTKPNNSRTRIH